MTVQPAVFEYRGYQIPMHLVNLTGGGADTWEAIARGHMGQYDRYAPIQPEHRVLEIGCGVGRDAMELTDRLNSAGEYIGVDIIYPSIQWCQRNITPRFPNFSFVYFDVYSQIHNSTGTTKTTDISLPLETGSIDRIILQSVFTHMFEDDITHYMTEFNRVLKPGGLVVASFFVTDQESLAMVQGPSPSGFHHEHKPLTFQHVHGDPAAGCYVNDLTYPEGAVGYTVEAIERMLATSGLQLVPPIHRGMWCGRTGVSDGQDMLVLKKAA